MADQISQYKELCKCGCAKDSHFEKKAMCLNARCDCKAYRDPDSKDPDTLPSPARPRYNDPRPHIDYDCKCAACRSWRQRNRHYHF